MEDKSTNDSVSRAFTYSCSFDICIRQSLIEDGQSYRSTYVKAGPIFISLLNFTARARPPHTFSIFLSVQILPRFLFIFWKMKSECVRHLLIQVAFVIRDWPVALQKQRTWILPNLMGRACRSAGSRFSRPISNSVLNYTYLEERFQLNFDIYSTV